MTEVLVLSVGGSPQPLRTAIEARAWDRIVFVVSDGVGATPSSRGQVEAAAISYGRDPDGRDRSGPGLRHLLGCPRDIAIVGVPPDDLDRALALIDSALAAEIAAGRTVTVDYTGGTKTMTAAMVMAASGHEGVALRFMAGRRADLTQVEAGTETPVEMPAHLLGVANLFALARAEVRRRAYGPALGLMSQVERSIAVQKAGLPGPPKSWRLRTEAWRKCLAILDAWDRFDVRAAWSLLESALDVGASWAETLDRSGHAARLRALAEERQRGPGPALCEDLWLNAQRRAALGLYDDAIARLYRLAEAAVQAGLALRHGIPDTGNVPLARVPVQIREQCRVKTDRRTGAATVELPLFRALDFLAWLDPTDPLAAVWPRDDKGFVSTDWQRARNKSILAHGFQSAAIADWKAAASWFDDRRSVLWEDLLGRATAAQLPDTLP